MPISDGHDELFHGKFRITGELGEGGMARVVSAVEVALGREVALKIMNDKLLVEPTAAVRFEREARAAAALESEHAVRILAIGRLASGVPYIVMERLVGEDLAHALARTGQFDIERACRCIFEACDAVGEAHARGLVHRDLKPANLFLAQRPDGHERVVVLDFGLVKAFIGDDSAITIQGAVVGSPAYMSPEQRGSPGDVDPRTDVWALGLCLYELLSGERAKKIFENGPYVDVPPLQPKRPDVPPRLEAIVMRCLARDPEERFSDARELARALAAFARPRRARWLRVGAIAAIAAIAAAVIAVVALIVR
jgi:serine/threonine-protein kinase